MHTFGEFVAVESRTLKPLIGVAKVTDAFTGETVETLDAGGNPAQVSTGARGHVAEFYTSEDHVLVRVELPGGPPTTHAAKETLEAAARAVELTVSTTRPDGGLWVNPTEEA